jgi:octaprenyl-diphosphate synthase
MSVVRVEEAERGSKRTFGGVFSVLTSHLTALDGFLRGQLDAFEPEIRSLVDYCIDTSGKRIRPALVFLSGWRGPAAISPDLVRLAAVVEMVHLATLVHDDIMDGAEIRRNRQTAANTYGPTASVLLGDALFAHALHLATQFPTTEVCAAVSESTRRVCSGEIVQTLRRGSTDITLLEYRRIIDLKTAELFRVSCLLGAKLAGYPSAYVEAAARFGRHLGIAYQIFDDLADYFADEKNVGKTLGTDLASGKLTLPLLHLMDRLSPAEREKVTDEILRKREPQLALRVAQMNELGVFASVAAEVEQEIVAGEQALAPWSDEPPTSLLLSLGEVLRNQVASLRGF